MYQILGGIPVKTRISGFFLDLFRDHRRRQQHSTFILAESWIDVEKSASHHQSQTEIGSDNPCYQHLSAASVK